jgi:hypothetical protein
MYAVCIMDIPETREKVRLSKPGSSLTRNFTHLAGLDGDIKREIETMYFTQPELEATTCSIYMPATHWKAGGGGGGGTSNRKRGFFFRLWAVASQVVWWFTGSAQSYVHQSQP